MDDSKEYGESEPNVIPLFRGDETNAPLPLDATAEEQLDIVFSDPEVIKRLLGHVHGGDKWEKEFGEQPIDSSLDEDPILPPINIFRNRTKPPKE
jgi:hypothetical protein